jgi:hypothetical protein
MGSPLAPVLSNLVLEHLFDTVLPTLDFSPKIFKFYVDDCFCIIPLTQIQNVLNKLNSFNVKLQFTFEQEDSLTHTLPFLDMSIIHWPDNTIKVDWYNKPTASNCILNYHSNHSYSQKINVATSFARRVFSLSDPMFKKTNKQKIHNILGKNNYPEHIIKQIINKTSNTQNNLQPTLSNPPEPPKYSSLHFIPNLSNRIKRSITSHNQNIKIAYKTTRQLKNTIFSNMKTQINAENRSGIVYKIGCSDCDQSYIGETSKKLSTRIGQHQSDYKRRHTPGPKTALINHTLDNNHKFDFDNASILDRENNVQKRRLLEAGHIIIHGKDAVNIKSDSQQISTQYYTVINKHKLNISPKPKNISSQQPYPSPHPAQLNNNDNNSLSPHR